MDKKHQCSECGKTFSKKCLLDIHIRIHTGEKTFLCEICGKTFSQYGTLFRHRKIHFREFECNYDGCDFSTDHYFKLIRHVNREHLQAKSSQSSSKEPNERKHQCDKCPKKFLYKSQLQRHVRSHTGERPFLCQICKKAFTQKAHLKGHMALMHLNEETVSLSQECTEDVTKNIHSSEEVKLKSNLQSSSQTSDHQTTMDQDVLSAAEILLQISRRRLETDEENISDSDKPSTSTQFKNIE
ncbi:zinc finger protein 184-like [Centruroides sculpturatus]|uniref:zinc finger protein 184-like n=1 Tax=Centruroides sculpturatus TaxID=218467 RepID=UPI000C6CCA42|nr:zinc finger protein 184-like [Centruroides sculpturatus]